MKKTKIMRFDVMLNAMLEAHKNLKNKTYGYNGPLLESNSLLVVSQNFDTLFTKENIEFLKEHRGKKEIEILLMAALQLGIQQGINMCSEEPKKYLDTNSLKLFLNSLI